MESEVIIQDAIHGTIVKPKDVQGKIPGVLLFHGFGTHRNEVGNIFKNFANQLADSGIASLRIDFSGFGSSIIDPSKVTLSDMIDDAHKAYDYLTHLDFIDQTRVGACGFSLGAGITILLAASEKVPVKSIVLLAPAGNLIEDFKTHVGETIINNAVSTVNNSLVEIKFNWRDKLVMSSDFFKTLTNFDLKKSIRGFRGSFFAVAGTDDFTCEHAKDYHQLVPSNSKDLWLIPDANHVFNFAEDAWELGNEVVEKCTQRFSQTL